MIEKKPDGVKIEKVTIDIKGDSVDIGILKTFLEVYRTRHFGQAAENLFLTQSAVSARIRLLEQTMGVPIFTRDRNNIELTAAGQKLLKHAETILTTWNRARQEIAIEDNSQIPLAVGGLPSLWDILLQNWLNNLLNQNQNLSVHAEVHGSEMLVKRLIDGLLDVVFLFESVQMPEIMVEEVCPISLIMVSSKKGIKASQAVAENYVFVDWGTSFSITHAQHFPEIVPPKLHVQLGRLAQNYLADSGGSAYLAEAMVQEELKNKRLFLVNDAPVIKRIAYAAFSPRSDQREFIEHALQSIHQ
ncbi:LysR family transcriptional regulator [Kaarinaea lacus]